MKRKSEGGDGSGRSRMKGELENMRRSLRAVHYYNNVHPAPNLEKVCVPSMYRGFHANRGSGGTGSGLYVFLDGVYGINYSEDVPVLRPEEGSALILDFPWENPYIIRTYEQLLTFESAAKVFIAITMGIHDADQNWVDASISYLQQQTHARSSMEYLLHLKKLLTQVGLDVSISEIEDTVDTFWALPSDSRPQPLTMLLTQRGYDGIVNLADNSSRSGSVIFDSEPYISKLQGHTPQRGQRGMGCTGR